jgi:hypothetical protein
MNNDTLVKRSFGFPIGTLIRDAQRLLGALNDSTVASPIVDYLTPTFVGELDNQIALVTKLSTDQSGAVGSAIKLTSSQADAQTDFVRLAAAARRAAKFAFANDDALLRSEFQVGLSGPRDIPTRLDRGRKLLAACRTYATELAARGFSTANADRLEQALTTLQTGDSTHEAAKDGKQGLTAQCRAAANQLYQQCVTVQHAARVAYAGASAPGNPTAVEARARFLLDEFPPRVSAAAKVVTPPTPVPAQAVAHPAVAAAA